MVFGLFEGGIELLTDKTSYAFGETVTGKIRLKLKQPKKANALELRFYGEKSKGVAVSLGSSSNRAGSNAPERIAEVRITVDGEKEYFNQEYPFEFALPKQNPVGLPDSEFAKTAIQVVAAFSGGTINVKWFLEAHLDLPMSIDISKKIQLTVA
ncbi:MAG: hypothetical protein V1811_02790 [Candidatus Micrarchaeota archaeon]